MLGLDQRSLAEACGLSIPTIQRMEACEGVIRGNVDSLMKLVTALERAGIELIGDNAASSGGGRGVRFRVPAPAAAPRPQPGSLISLPRKGTKSADRGRSKKP